MQPINYIIYARHTIRAKWATEKDKVSKIYKELTVKGVKIARNTASKTIKNLIDDLPNNAVIVISGCDRESRTEETLKVFGKSLCETYKKRKNIILINLATCVNFINHKRPEVQNIKQVIEKKIRDNPDNKIIIYFPTIIKYWSRSPDFYIRPGVKSLYSKILFGLTKYSDKDSALWIGKKGRLNFKGKEIIGPRPQDVAERMILGLKILFNKTTGLAGNRSTMIVCVGHGKKLDALTTYLTNNGRVDYRGFLKLGGKKIKPSEVGIIKNYDNKLELMYRNKSYKIPAKIAEKLIV